jgi:MSHA biogenesis protein MshN
MLKDLEVRRDGAERVARPIFQDLHSAHGERRRGRGPWVVVPVLAILAGTALYSWDRWSDQPTGYTRNSAPAVTLAQVPPATPESPAPAPPQVQERAPAPAVAAKSPKPAASSKPAKASGTPAVIPSAQVMKNRQNERNKITSVAEAASGQMEKTDRPYTAEEQAEITYQNALRLKAQGNMAEAERQLKSLLIAQPKHVNARELLVGIHFANGRVPQAQETLEQGVTQVPAHLAFRYQLARLYLERGEEPRAVILLEEARRQGHADPELPAFLAALYQRAGRHADAVKNYQMALAAKPQEGRWWVGLGISLETQQDSGAAREAYRRALDTGRLTASLARYAEDRLKALIAR